MDKIFKDPRTYHNIFLTAFLIFEIILPGSNQVGVTMSGIFVILIYLRYITDILEGR